MKRQWLSLLLVVLVFFPGTALANSLPYFYQGGISGTAFSVSDQPISVGKEVLSFSIFDETKLYNAAVRASYDLVNDGKEHETVSMLFPILFWPEDVETLEQTVSVTVDTISVPCRYSLLKFDGGEPPPHEFPNPIWEREEFLQNVQYESILKNMEDQGITPEQFLLSGIKEQYKTHNPENLDIPTMLLVLYEVSFAPGQERHVEVSYQQRGMTPNNNTKHAQDADFYYLLNPAKGFASFGTLDISIELKAKGTRLTADGFDFIRGKDGVYRASFQGLPEQDLHFQLSRGDKNWGLYYLLMLIALPPLLVLGIGVLIVVLLLRYRKKNARGVSRPN